MLTRGSKESSNRDSVLRRHPTSYRRQTNVMSIISQIPYACCCWMFWQHLAARWQPTKQRVAKCILPRARGATTSFRRQTTLLMHVPHVFMFSPMLPFMCIRCFFTYTDTAFSCPVIGKSVTDSLLRALGQQFRVLERGIHLTNCFLYTSLQNSAEAKLLREPLMGSKEFPIKRF